MQVENSKLHQKMADSFMQQMEINEKAKWKRAEHIYQLNNASKNKKGTYWKKCQSR